MAPDIVPTRAYDIMHPKSERLYQATDVIYKLLRVVGTEVCSFRRNHQVAYRLVERARDLYDAINARIHLVDINDSWEDYEVYTQAIDPLEEILLNIIPVVFDEQGLDHLSTSTWAEYVRVTEQWCQNRLAIRNCFQDLRTKPQFKALMTTLIDDGDDVLSAYTLDDLSYLDYLLEIIGENVPRIVEPNIKEYAEKVAEGLSRMGDLQRQESGTYMRGIEEIGVLPIQYAFLSSRMVTMVVNSSTPQDVRDHLLSNTSLWGALANLIIDTCKFMASQLVPESSERAPGPFAETNVTVTTAIDQLKARYASLVNQAAEPLILEVPQAYSRLLPLVGRINRRYHAQSLLLVSLCRQAASNFVGPKRTMGSRKALERALNQTVAALEAAQSSESGRGSPVNGSTKDSTGSCMRLYEQSAQELAVCFETMEIRCDVDHQEKLRQAQSKDNTRVVAVNEKLAKYEHPPMVEVAVDVYENNQNGRKVKALSFASIPLTGRLEYLKHLVASQLEDRASAQVGHFERVGGHHVQPVFLSLDSQLKGAIGEGNKGTVVFIVHPSGEK
ncbi:hypothetical protein FRC11_007985, partial [Ceratobasidium sp. 423]